MKLIRISAELVKKTHRLCYPGNGDVDIGMLAVCFSLQSDYWTPIAMFIATISCCARHVDFLHVICGRFINRIEVH